MRLAQLRAEQNQRVRERFLFGKSSEDFGDEDKDVHVLGEEAEDERTSKTTTKSTAFPTATLSASASPWHHQTRVRND